MLRLCQILVKVVVILGVINGVSAAIHEHIVFVTTQLRIS